MKIYLCIVFAVFIYNCNARAIDAPVEKRMSELNEFIANNEIVLRQETGNIADLLKWKTWVAKMIEWTEWAMAKLKNLFPHQKMNSLLLKLQNFNDKLLDLAALMDHANSSTYAAIKRLLDDVISLWKSLYNQFFWWAPFLHFDLPTMPPKPFTFPTRPTVIVHTTEVPVTEAVTEEEVEFTTEAATEEPVEATTEASPVEEEQALRELREVSALMVDIERRFLIKDKDAIANYVNKKLEELKQRLQAWYEKAASKLPAEVREAFENLLAKIEEAHKANVNLVTVGLLAAMQKAREAVAAFNQFIAKLKQKYAYLIPHLPQLPTEDEDKEARELREISEIMSDVERRFLLKDKDAIAEYVNIKLEELKQRLQAWYEKAAAKLPAEVREAFEKLRDKIELAHLYSTNLVKYGLLAAMLKAKEAVVSFNQFLAKLKEKYAHLIPHFPQVPTNFTAEEANDIQARGIVYDKLKPYIDQQIFNLKKKLDELDKATKDKFLPETQALVAEIKKQLAILQQSLSETKDLTMEALGKIYKQLAQISATIWNELVKIYKQ